MRLWSIPVVAALLVFSAAPTALSPTQPSEGRQAHGGNVSIDGPANVVLSSEQPEGSPPVMAAPGDSVPDGMKFYLEFTLDWQGERREEFQMIFKLVDPEGWRVSELRLWQFFGTDQIEIRYAAGGFELKEVIANGLMRNGTKDWVIQITDNDRLQVIVDGRMYRDMPVENVDQLARTNFYIGRYPDGVATDVWGEYTNIRADLDGDGIEDFVDLPEPRLPKPIVAQPIPDLPNPVPDGFLNTAKLPNQERVIPTPDSGNPIIDSIATSHAWKGDVIAFGFMVQDIDNNGIMDFDEGRWREFYTGMLDNVTTFTGVEFWERPEDEATIAFQLVPGGGGASGLPGLGAAPSSGTKVGISGSAAEAGEFIPAPNFTHTWFHETGHALGMAHPHEYGPGDGIDTGIGEGGAAVNRPGDHFLNSKLYSSTTYSPKIWGEDNPFTPEVDFGTSTNSLVQTTYLTFDIAALQHKYGVNEDYANGDDVYAFSDDKEASRGLRAIWDTGGNDTFRYTGEERAVINLNDATLRQEVGGGGFLSTSEVKKAGLLIANGVVIENAFGGPQQDFITGNEVANSLSGLGGDDILTGGAGNDVIDGGSGYDTAVMEGLASEANIADLGDGGYWVTLADGSIDSLRDVESLRFEDGEIVTLSDTAFPDRPDAGPGCAPAQALVAGSGGSPASSAVSVGLVLLPGLALSRRLGSRRKVKEERNGVAPETSR